MPENILFFKSQITEGDKPVYQTGLFPASQVNQPLGGSLIAKENAMQTAYQILSAYLKEKGFDGLVCSCIDCGCAFDDIAPCGGISDECEPAHGNHETGFYPVVEARPIPRALDGVCTCDPAPEETDQGIGNYVCVSCGKPRQ